MIKCAYCGADVENGTCPYCGTKYNLDELYNSGSIADFIKIYFYYKENGITEKINDDRINAICNTLINKISIKKFNNSDLKIYIELKKENYIDTDNSFLAFLITHLPVMPEKRNLITEEDYGTLITLFEINLIKSYYPSNNSFYCYRMDLEKGIEGITSGTNNIDISSESIHKIYEGNFESLEVLFHEATHISFANNSRDIANFNVLGLMTDKRRILCSIYEKLFNSDEFYLKNYQNDLEESCAEYYGYGTLTNFLSFHFGNDVKKYVSLDKLTTEANKFYNKVQTIFNSGYPINSLKFGDNKIMLIDELFDKVLSSYPDITSDFMNDYPFLSIDYKLKDGVYCKRNKDEYNELLESYSDEKYKNITSYIEWQLKQLENTNELS